MDAVVDAAAGFYDVPLLDVLGKTRQRPAATARLMVYYVATFHYGLAASAIAKSLGRNFSTVVKGIASAAATIPDVVELSLLVKERADRRLRG